MSLQEKLQEDLKDAMRSRDSTRKSVIRYLRSEIRNEEIARQKPLDDDWVIEVVGRQAKQHRDSIEAFKQGNRQDLVEKEKAELAIILGYLPEQLSDEELSALATRAIEEIGATGPQEMGKVMGRIMPEVKGRAEGRRVSQVVSELLKGQAG